MCGYESIQQQSKRDKYIPPSSSPSDFVQCISCEKYTCSNCIYGCLATASSISGINNEMMESNSSLKSLQRMKRGIEESPPSLSVEQAICCAFKCIIPEDVRQSIAIPPRATSHPSPIKETSDAVVNDSSDAFLPRKAELKMHCSQINKTEGNDLTVCNFLYYYHNNSTKYSCKGEMKVTHLSGMIMAMNSKRKRRKTKSARTKVKNNICEGLLVMPMFGLAVQADVCASHLRST